MKIHVGSGTVYLTGGWTNVDVDAPCVHLAEHAPSLVAAYSTTEDRYYARHEDKTVGLLAGGAVTKESVCDAYGSFGRLPCGIGGAEEILARQVFEHLDIARAHEALDECDRVLAPGGTLRLDVPNHYATLKELRETQDPERLALLLRHFQGSRRDSFAYHAMSYSREALRAIVEEHGFEFEAEEPNVHFYPAFCLRWRKPGPRPAHVYLAIPDPPAGESVLEIGPGRFPWARADAYVDRRSEFLAPLAETGKRVAEFDLDELVPGGPKLPFSDKQFDFCLMSHVLEHVRDPIAVAAEVSRVARRGMVICPHAWKDAVFLFEEGEHRWLALDPTVAGGPMLLVPVDYARRSRLADPNASKALSRIFRTGPSHFGSDSRVLRRWFWRNEDALDVAHAWEGDLRVAIAGRTA